MTSQAVMKRYLTSVAKNNEEYKDNKSMQTLVSLIANYKKLEAKDKEELDAKIEIAYGKLQAKGVSASKSTSKATTTRRTKSSSDGGLKAILADLKKKLGAEKFRDATRGTDILKDIQIPALKKGKRIVRKKGKTTNQYGTFKNKVGRAYWESRANRYDANQPSQTRKYKLADGGNLEKFKEGDIVTWKNNQYEIYHIGNLSRYSSNTFSDTKIYLKPLKDGLDEVILDSTKGLTKQTSYSRHLETRKRLRNDEDTYPKGTEFAKGGDVGNKVYNEMYGVGSSKYLVNFHDGQKTHKDGSPFFDIRIFKNKVEKDKFVKELKSKGFVYKYAKGGKTSEVNYNDILPILKEKLEDSIDNLPRDYEYSSEYKGEEVESKSRDGFMAFTDGGYEVTWFESISYFSGSGNNLPTKALDNEMQRQIDQNYEYAKDRFKDEYSEIVEELGEENIDYNSLYEAGYESEAEQLSEWENDYDGSGTIMCEIGAYYYNPSNSRGIEGEHTIRLFGLVNLESPYHRSGNLEDRFDVDITFSSIAEMEEKIDKGLSQIIEWFNGANYNESTEKLRIVRMAKGGKLSSKAKYIPKRDIAEIEVEKNGKSKSIDGANLLDGVYVKKGTKFAQGGKTKKFGYSIELVVKKDYGNEGGIIANFVGKGDAMISARALNENSPKNYEYSVKESSKMAKGGLTEHGLEVGDEIVMDVKKTTMGKMPTTIGVKDYDKEFHLVDLDKGERYAKGGEVEEMALSKSRLEFAEYNLSELEKEGKTSSNSSQYREWERFKKQYENKIKRLEETLNPTFPKIKMENISDEDLKKKHTRALWNVNELRLGNLKPSKVIKTGRVTKEKADQFLMDIAKQYEIEMKKRGMPVYAQGGTTKRIKRKGC